MVRPKLLSALCICLPFASVACGGAEPPVVAPSPPSIPAAPVASATVAEPAREPVTRGDWNRAAQELGVPFLWVRDANGDGAPSLDELALLWGVPVPPSLQALAGKETFVTGDAIDALEKARADNAPTLASAVLAATLDRARGARLVSSTAGASQGDLVRLELAQSRPTLVVTDLSGDLKAWQPFVRKIEAAGRLLEALYDEQLGVTSLLGQVPAGDPAARTLFFRNHGPQCEAPKTQNEAGCTAIPGLSKARRSGLYPEGMVAAPNFCETLTKADKRLMDPFHVVQGDKARPTAVPYTTAYRADMGKVAALLRDASKAIPDEKETALKAYLAAAAQAFEDNDWFKADEAWAKMGVDNSRWYLRAAPDETYGEPCNTKALFHLSFGLINQESLAWQKKLDPLKKDMEAAIAGLAGAPYKARAVSFKLPDFVDITLNTGDSRPPSGVTIGQSLPNFGPVANEGRGRTVAMTNFYSDPDSVAAQKASAESLFCADAMAVYTTDPGPQLMSTVLHEAAHNLGPAHQYKVGGRVDREVFGGPLASTLEEWKAQSAALFFADWLASQGKITETDAAKAHVRDLAWAFGHVSRGMYTETKQPRSYSQLAAIQLGMLLDDGAITWHSDKKAANGQDLGCFSVTPAEFPKATKHMLTVAAGIKGRGDKALAGKMVKEHVDCEGATAARCKTMQAAITERVLRQPKATFLYSVKLR